MLIEHAGRHHLGAVRADGELHLLERLDVEIELRGAVVLVVGDVGAVEDVGVLARIDAVAAEGLVGSRSVPPTFTVLDDTPGVWAMIPHTSRGFGTVDISSLVNVKLADAVDVSRIGDTPDTVTVCSRAADFHLAFTAKVDASGRGSHRRRAC